MERNFLIPFVLAVLALTQFAAAQSLDISSYAVAINDLDASSNAVSVETGEIASVDLYFTAGESATDVEVSAWVEGERNSGASKNFADLIEGKEYHARLDLGFPKDIDETENDLTFFIRIETDEGSWEQEFTVNVQRVPFNAEILFVETKKTAESGTSLPIDIVIKNLGRHELEDLVVRVEIAELGLSKRAYFGDLTPIDEDDDSDKVDSKEGRINLEIPSGVKSGVYDLRVEAYSSDTSAVKTFKIAVIGAELESRVVVPVASRNAKAGETATYDLIVVNSGKKAKTYEIAVESIAGLTVEAEDAVIVVPADSSRAVKITATGTEQGTYNFKVDVISDSATDKANLNLVVSEKAFSTSNVTILTLVLAIVFIVLLVVLIVLLTRKPAREEIEESYY